MSRKRVIEAKDIVNDIRSGMSEAELMEKYSLSSKGLQSAFQKLIKGGIMMAEEVYGQYQTGRRYGHRAKYAGVTSIHAGRGRVHLRLGPAGPAGPLAQHNGTRNRHNRD